MCTLYTSCQFQSADISQAFNNIFLCLGKEPDGTQIRIRDDMNITVAQIFAARSGKPFFEKWPNGKIPYTFVVSEYEVGLYQAEQNIVKKVAERFNKDLNGCASIK